MSTTTQDPALDPTAVSSLRVPGPHRLRLCFADGLVSELDFSAFVEAAKPGTLRQPLCDQSFFAQAWVDHGVVTWPNGYDVAPETMRSWAEQGCVSNG
jgi:hypothetical protein